MADNNIVPLGDGQQQHADIMKRTIKDSVFTNLFQDKKYLLQLYKAPIRKILMLRKIS